MSCKCGAESVSLDCVFQTEALLRHEASRRITFRSLPRDCILHTGPGIQRHYRPITAECEMPSVALNTPPRPGALRPFRADVSRPRLQCVGIGISMQRLHAGNHSKFSETRDIGCGCIFDVFNPVASIRRV